MFNRMRFIEFDEIFFVPQENNKFISFQFIIFFIMNINIWQSYHIINLFWVAQFSIISD